MEVAPYTHSIFWLNSGSAILLTITHFPSHKKFMFQIDNG